MEQSDPLWSAVDRYLTDTLVGPDPILEAVLAANAAAGLPAIDVSPPQGKMLHLLARLAHAHRILEIGTLGGYSTIWLARALPADGRLITLEFEPRHAAVAQRNLNLAGVAHLVEIRLGPALESLAQLQAESTPPFDLIFIDADKPNNANYLDRALKLSHPGTLIVADNVIRDGQVADHDSKDPSVQGTQAMFAAMASEPRLLGTAIQTVGAKGYDGFAFALVCE
jgi:predicted O-methyltransferase YrrM